MIWILFYNWIIVPLGWFAFHLYALLNSKAKRGLQGRKGMFERLEHQLSQLDQSSKRVWFHSSSMGEFEQAKPIIAGLKKKFPHVEIIVSFFSPSGFEHSQTYKLARIITYIPFDSRANARRFIGLLKPSAAVIVRYDVWPNHIWELRKQGIPVYIASATLHRSTSRRYPLLHHFHRAVYNCLNYILTVSEDDKNVFESFELTRPVLKVVGDTRYDQVRLRSDESRLKHVLPPRIVEAKTVLVIGSSWSEDERQILPACISLLSQLPKFLVILVPHEPNEENLERVEFMLNGKASHIRFSELNDYKNEQCIIIDSVGILMALYQYAHAAYVGGSFGSGVHNVLEPAAYGVPILFGPKHENSQEAVILLGEGGAFTGDSADTLLAHMMRLFTDDREQREAGKKALTLVERNTGATARVLSYLEKVL